MYILFYLSPWTSKLKGVVFVFADVARPHSEIQRWRTWCDWDLCFLELTRTSSRPGSLLFCVVLLMLLLPFLFCFCPSLSLALYCLYMCVFILQTSKKIYQRVQIKTKSKSMQLRKINGHCFTYYSQLIWTV